MPGFRRIDTDLLLRYRGKPERVMALLELDLDHFRDRVRPTREYARLWSVTHKVARGIVAEYLQSRADWAALERAQPGHGQGTDGAQSTIDFAQEKRRRGHTKGTGGAQAGHTTLETETVLGAPPSQGGPPVRGPQLVADPDELWSPPGDLTPRARDLNRAIARERQRVDEARPERDLIRIRHAENLDQEASG